MYTISFVFRSLRKINLDNGFDYIVKDQSVRVKVWIHFIIGYTEGNNKMLGQYPGNKEGVQRPYRDCHCTYNDLSNTNPKCKYRTLDEFNLPKDANARTKMVEKYITNPIQCMTLRIH